MFYQLKSMLQGVVQRGTAAAIRRYGPYVAGKTGTTDNENDAWFVGFTNDVTVAVWVGYDNAQGRRTLGRGQTGAKVALPIFDQIIQAVWHHQAPPSALAPPSPEARRKLVGVPIDVNSGERLPAQVRGAFTEYLRADRYGQIQDTQYRLVPAEQAYAYRGYPGQYVDGETLGSWWGESGNRPFAGFPYWRDPRAEAPWGGGGLFGQPQPRTWYGDDPRRYRQQQRRVDPDYFWGRRIE
jgi:membrane peptidoglycan carboxypeptidase